MLTLDQRILNLTKNYMGKLWHKKVLTSMEEVEANTNETNLVAAPVVAELNNKLESQLTDLIITRTVASPNIALQDTLGQFTQFTITVPTVSGYKPIAICEQWFEKHLVDFSVTQLQLSDHRIYGYITANTNIGNYYTDTKVVVKVLYIRI